MPQHEYETVAMTVVAFGAADVVCTSGFGDGGEVEVPPEWGGGDEDLG